MPKLLMHGVSSFSITEGSIAESVYTVTLKTFRLRAYLKLEQLFKRAILKARLAERFCRAPKAATPKIAKPYSRH